jgi:hypothetical protein
MIHPTTVAVLSMLVLGVLPFGCDMPPDEYLPPDASVEDTDGDTDSQAGPEECPWNSGYPCSCDRIDEDCDDQSKCLWVVGDGEWGICSAVCYEPHTDCVKTGFDGESSCLLEGDGISFRCALLCEEDDHCPPDQSCVETTWGDSLCHP